MAEKVAVIYPKKGSSYNKVYQELDQFSDNKHIQKVTVSQTRGLLEDLNELKLRGFGGILHVVNGLTWTGVSIAESIPESIRNNPELYRQVHILTPAHLDKLDSVLPHAEYIRKYPESAVIINPDGSIIRESKVKLERLFRSPTGIILGGGDGHPGDGVYRPLLEQVYKSIKSKTPITAICLGHQMIGDILGGEFRNGEVIGGFFQLGSQNVHVLEDGKKQEVFKRLGDNFTSVFVNKLHYRFDKDKPPFIRVLAEDIAKNPVALEIDGEKEGQIITAQFHPEFFMVDKISSSKSVHPALKGLVQDLLTRQMGSLKRTYDFKMTDLLDLIDERRLFPHLGKRFFSPAISWMAKMRLQD